MTFIGAIVRLTVSLLPVIVFLIALIILDSYKLIRLRAILYSILMGCIVAFSCLWINNGLMAVLGIGWSAFARYVAPIIEEVLKASYLVLLMKRNRVGFMVDASIHGFAIGTGFAIIENIYYFQSITDPNLLLWLVRGFGTAIMHGGVTAIVGIVAKQMADRTSSSGVMFALPGLAIAIALHSFFNHFSLATSFALLVVLPLVIFVVFRASERATRAWLGMRMDTDASLLEMINSGRASESPVGKYLQSLKTSFPGGVVADMLCMLRLHLELSIRAKGILLMHEAGFKVPPDPEVEARFQEMKYLEKSIGKTGMLAVAPMFAMSDHDLWQLHMLGKK